MVRGGRRVLELAERVEGLRTPEFDAAVKSLNHGDFVTAAQKAYEEAGEAEEPEGPGTPTVAINDQRIPLDCNAVLLEGDAFAELLRQIYDRPEMWDGGGM
ncbi:hypothetical protein [Streptomyces sp. NPDC088254]|uniref:hypothetical protein n=1 Tax=Streptomyces sp. NPDC088254 TaxID=3365847 RepID=UPI00382F676E